MVYVLDIITEQYCMENITHGEYNTYQHAFPVSNCIFNEAKHGLSEGWEEKQRRKKEKRMTSDASFRHRVRKSNLTNDTSVCCIDKALPMTDLRKNT